MKTTEEQLYKVGLWALGAGCVVMFLYLKFLAPVLPEGYCAFWRMFKLYCPGCGGTRAVWALFHGHILASFWYHPLVLYTAVIFGGFMLTHTLEQLHIPRIRGWRFHNWYLWGALGLVTANWIVKNILLIGFQITL